MFSHRVSCFSTLPVNVAAATLVFKIPTGQTAQTFSWPASRLPVAREIKSIHLKDSAKVMPEIAERVADRPLAHEMPLSWSMTAILESESIASLATLVNKLDQRTARIGVIGLGYVGLPLALLFSEQKFKVTGFDVDPGKIRVLAQGGSYIIRIPENEVRAARDAGFAATADYSLTAQMDVVIICVPTPLNAHHEPDLSFITVTAESLTPYLRPGQLIVLESTTYPGTTEELLIPILEKNPLELKAARGQNEDEASRGRTFYVDRKSVV